MNVLKRQLEFAEKNSLAVVIHSREATGDMLEILKCYKIKGIIHCVPSCLTGGVCNALFPFLNIK